MSFIQKWVQSTSSCHVHNLFIACAFKRTSLINYQQCRGAKRRGYRLLKQAEMKKLKAQKKQQEALKAKTEPNLRLDIRKVKVKNPRPSEENLRDKPIDDVFDMTMYKKIAFPFKDVIEWHRETHHPTMFNEPNALVEASIELNMRTKRKTRFLGPFSGVLLYPKTFEYEKPKRIVAVCKKTEDQEKAIAAGAAIVGGADVVKLIKTKKVTADDFDHIVCHSDMLLDLAEVRGILKDHFPNKLKGNFGQDIPKLVKDFMRGVDYAGIRNEYFLNFGLVEVPFGRLTMSTEDMLENLTYLLKTVDGNRAKDLPNGTFIDRVIIKSMPSKEKLCIRHWDLLDGYEEPTTHKDDDGDEDDTSEGKIQEAVA